MVLGRLCYAISDAVNAELTRTYGVLRTLVEIVRVGNGLSCLLLAPAAFASSSFEPMSARSLYPLCSCLLSFPCARLPVLLLPTLFDSPLRYPSFYFGVWLSMVYAHRPLNTRCSLVPRFLASRSCTTAVCFAWIFCSLRSPVLLLIVLSTPPLTPSEVVL
jgi:hypothetical protein